MIHKRKINAFKVVAGCIEYTDAVKAAVLNPRVTFTHLHLNGGWDWVDQKYGFIQLLLKRGQILSIETHSDLLACEEYLQAAKFGLYKSYSYSVQFVTKPISKQCAGASEKRMEAARNKWTAFCQGGAK